MKGLTLSRQMINTKVHCLYAFIYYFEIHCCMYLPSLSASLVYNVQCTWVATRIRMDFLYEWSFALERRKFLLVYLWTCLIHVCMHIFFHCNLHMLDLINLDDSIQSLRGPRGGMIFFKKDSVLGVDLESAINNAVFPGLQVCWSRLYAVFLHMWTSISFSGFYLWNKWKAMIFLYRVVLITTQSGDFQSA